uniref:Uncharacterized protein n=1 Tax=Sparus aurata TaxID=8175 RepID=A0A671W9K4_SPAAU
MAAPMWRMNGLWRRMAGVLVLCALLLSSEYTYGSYLQHPPCCSPDLGVKNVEAPSSSGSSVLVGLLVSGLLAAVAITVGYCKCQRRPEKNGVKLAEEADQENQGNTLVSVAPLNPPPETQEKPSVNGESPEAAKTQPPPPTNGHSTTKTADTEL